MGTSSADSQLQTLLTEGLSQLSLPLADDVQQKLLQFVALIDKWNKVYNLTAVREPIDMVSHHLLDSLSILPYLKGSTVLDVGTGAGLPGIPLALASPERQFVLIDSALKRTRFVLQAVGELGLSNVKVVQSRIEDFQPDEKFDTVISRAFTATEMFVDKTGHLCKESGQLLAMKGRYPTQEISDLPINWVYESHKLAVPGVEGERHIVILQPSHSE